MNYCNPGGIGSKLQQLYPAIATDEYDVVVIIESWLNASHLAILISRKKKSRENGTRQKKSRESREFPGTLKNKQTKQTKAIKI